MSSPEYRSNDRTGHRLCSEDRAGKNVPRRHGRDQHHHLGARSRHTVRVPAVREGRRTGRHLAGLFTIDPKRLPSEVSQLAAAINRRSQSPRRWPSTRVLRSELEPTRGVDIGARTEICRQRWNSRRPEWSSSSSPRTSRRSTSSLTASSPSSGGHCRGRPQLCSRQHG